MRNEPWVWPEVRDAGTSGAGAVPLRSAQLMGQQKKKKKKCVCHFSCSSTVTPSSQCFETCSPGMVSDFRFKGSWGVFWCFCLIAISMHFVFFGFGAI